MNLNSRHKLSFRIEIVDECMFLRSEKIAILRRGKGYHLKKRVLVYYLSYEISYTKTFKKGIIG